MKSLTLISRRNLRIIYLLICLIIFNISVTKAQSTALTGKALFETKCAKCHGNDGTKGRWGAKNLKISKLNDDELLKIISTGKGFMPNWSKKLAPAQILSVAAYIKTLRKQS
jgi:mono/diheme cytochrome c family protein